MRTIEDWLRAYGESHHHSVTRWLHRVCVPLIIVSLIGLLWCIPVPEAFEAISPLANWATLFIVASMIYYVVLSRSMAVGMLVVSAVSLAVVWWMDGLAVPLWLTSVVVFVVAWIGQFIGHQVEGRRPSFLEDVQFLMIGPLWLLADVYRKLGIRY
jgi:uncharacterized membrane protein YGL010W